MATKKGMLSDKAMMVNCVDYKALPVGFANAEFQGNMSNPYLQGIKTSKYQRAAPKPASADVVAVSNARFIAGNRANNARLILDQYQKEAKEFKPPPVNLAKIARGNKDNDDYIFGRVAPYVGPTSPRPPTPPSPPSPPTPPRRGRALPTVPYSRPPATPPVAGVGAGSVAAHLERQKLLRRQQAVNPMPTSSSGVSRGDLIMTQTIGQRSEQTIDANRLMAAYGSYTPQRQKEIGSKLGEIAQSQGITYINYGISSQVMKGRRIASQPPDQGAGVVDRTAMVSNLIGILQLRSSNAPLNQIFGVLTPENIQQAQQQRRAGKEPAGSSSVAGTSTDLSDALTQQGVAMPATTKTQPEIEKK